MSELSTLSTFTPNPIPAPNRSTTQVFLGFATQKSVTPVSNDSATLQAFAETIEQEFVHGSGIAPSLYAAGIALVADTEVLAGGEVACVRTNIESSDPRKGPIYTFS